MSFVSRSCLLSVLLLAPAPALAGSPGADMRAIPAPDRDRVDVDVLADGTIWVRGRTYKASFCGGGASYVPFLGSDAPRNFPLDLSVARVSVGGAELTFDADAPAVLEPGGTSIAFDRGSFTERYLLTIDSVEQTFVFDELPQRGEIVVSIGVESLFASRADAEGFRFENEHGHVRYGRAFAVDACGWKDSIESCLSGDNIEIRVPAERVADAVLPLTVDPILTTYSVRDTPIDEFAADTAYDEAEGLNLTVFEEVFSAQDHDVRVVLHTPSGSASLWQWIDSSNANWTSPAVANNNAANQFLVVAAVGAFPDREIQGRTVASNSTLATSPVIQISNAITPGDQYAPDVGGDPAPAGTTSYCVVWEVVPAAGERDVRARLVDNTGVLVGLGTLLVSNDPDELDGNPAVSNSNGDVPLGAKYWNVVFEREVSPTNRNIWSRRITAGGAMTIGPVILASTVLDERNPTATAGLENVAGDSPWLLAYQIEMGPSWDIRARVFEGTTELHTLELSAQFGSNSLHQTEPVCDTDGKSFVVAYIEQATLGFGTTDVKLSALYWSGGALGVAEGNVSVSPGLEVDLRPKICAAHSGGADSEQLLVVFDRDDAGPNQVMATSYLMPAGGSVDAFCFGDGSGAVCPCLNFGGDGRGCANSVNAAGARLFTTGHASLEAGNFTLHAEGLPNSTSVLFFQGSAQMNGGNGAMFGDGLRCASGTVIRLGTKTAVVGFASYPQFGDTSIAERGLVLPGATRYYQAHYRNSAVFCSAATFNLTNGMRALWIP